MGWPWWQHCSQSSSLCVVLCELHRLWSHYSNLLIHPWPGRWSRLPGRPCASMTSMAGISMYCMPWSPMAPSKLSRSRCLCLNAFVRIDDSVLLELKYAVGKTHLAFEMMANLKRPLRNPATPSCEIRSGDWSSENGQRRTQHCSSYWYPNYLSIRQNRHQREPFSSADHEYSRGLYKSSQQAGLGLGTSCDIRGIGEVTLHTDGHHRWAVCVRDTRQVSRLTNWTFGSTSHLRAKSWSKTQLIESQRQKRQIWTLLSVFCNLSFILYHFYVFYNKIKRISVRI